MRKRISRVLYRVSRHVAPSYIAGPALEDAIGVCHRMAQRGWRSTISPWDGPGDTPESVAMSYRQALNAIRDENLECYLSVKVPSLKYSVDLMKGVLESAPEKNIRVHFDSLAYETATESFELLEKSRVLYNNLGCTLPARWIRSQSDAERALDLGVAVRVVKGQWPDPSESLVETSSRFLDLIDILAGRAVMVSVATHDIALAKEALIRLRKSKTPCELEQLFGLPFRWGKVAGPLGIPTRIYIPYGHAYLPYALSEIKRRPFILAWLVRDLLKKKMKTKDSGY